MRFSKRTRTSYFPRQVESIPPISSDKKIKSTYTVILAMGAIAGSANAADFSFTGNFRNDNEVQEFHFAVTEQGVEGIGMETFTSLGATPSIPPPGTPTLSLLSYFGGINAAGTKIADGGFDPVVSLFDSSTGQFHGWARGQSSMWQTLSEGNYTVTLTQWQNVPSGQFLDEGFEGSRVTNFGGRGSHWALDILNVTSASLGNSYISPIPESKSYVLLLAGLGLVTLMARQRRKKFNLE